MTVKMIRDAEQFPAPHSADVHPSEVENYAAAGWTRADPIEQAVRKPRSKKVAGE